MSQHFPSASGLRQPEKGLTIPSRNEKVRYCPSDKSTFNPPPLPCDSSRLRSVSADSSHTALRFLGAADLPPNNTPRSVLHIHSASVRRHGNRSFGRLRCEQEGIRPVLLLLWFALVHLFRPDDGLVCSTRTYRRPSSLPVSRSAKILEEQSKRRL